MLILNQFLKARPSGRLSYLCRVATVSPREKSIAAPVSHNSYPALPSMTAPTVTSSQVRCALLREEIGLLDLQHEAAYATGHPLFAANMAADRIALEA
jgi:hypothetical protein